MPGSPDTSTARRAPSTVSFHAASTVSYASVRPANGNAGDGVDERGKRDRGRVDRRAPLDLAHRERRGQALQLRLPKREHVELGARAGERAHEVAHEDLAAVGRRAEPGRLDDGRAEPVAVLEASRRRR